MPSLAALSGTELTALGGMIATLLGAIGLIYKIQQESKRAKEQAAIDLEKVRTDIQTISFTQLEKTMPGLTNLVDWYEKKTLACENRCGEMEKRLDAALQALSEETTNTRHLTIQVGALKSQLASAQAEIRELKKGKS